MEADQTVDAFRCGAEQFNRREFFEAHETWEAIWLAASEPDKTFLQGITQISAGFFHYARGNRKGAESLLRRGLRRIEGFPSIYRGMKLEDFRRQVRAWRSSIIAGRDDRETPRPRIEWA